MTPTEIIELKKYCVEKVMLQSGNRIVTEKAIENTIQLFDFIISPLPVSSLQDKLPE